MQGDPFHNHGGTSLPHSGSGYCSSPVPYGDKCINIFRAIPEPLLHPHPYHNFPCHWFRRTHDKPTSLPKPDEWYELCIITAKHVVYNNEEARSTRVDFFCDDENSECNGKMKTAYGYEVDNELPGSDVCLLRCFTQDKDLIRQVEKTFAIMTGISLNLKSAPFTTLIVSHPHGMPKHITVGEKTQECPTESVPLTYTTSTCPGSSGAPVLFLPLWLSNRVFAAIFHSRATAMKSYGQGFMVSYGRKIHNING